MRACTKIVRLYRYQRGLGNSRRAAGCVAAEHAWRRAPFYDAGPLERRLTARQIAKVHDRNAVILERLGV